MILPQLQGSLTQDDFFIFTAADSVYFDHHGVPLINSILANTKYGVHIHIYNPRPDQLEFCNSNSRISVSYEYVDLSVFESIADIWLSKTSFKNERQRQMFNKGQQHGRQYLANIIACTYYACTRFIRINQLLKDPIRCLLIDVDGIVRKNFTYTFLNDKNTNVFLYQKRNNEHLAGALLLTENSKSFLNQYATLLETCINKNNIYWFLDQVVLDQVVPQYSKGLLPVGYIDWEMNEISAIWTAKGKRKSSPTFIAEQQKYIP